MKTILRTNAKPMTDFRPIEFHDTQYVKRSMKHLPAPTGIQNFFIFSVTRRYRVRSSWTTKERTHSL